MKSFFFKVGLSFFLGAIGASPAGGEAKINCLKPTSWKSIDFSGVCSSVIDVLKIEQGKHVTIDCLGPLEDGYMIGRCEAVNVDEQIKVRDRELQRRVTVGWGGAPLLCEPEVYAGKSEKCFDANHQLLSPSPGRLQISYLSDETKYLGRSADKEQFCIVSGSYGLYWGEEVNRAFSADLGTCKELLKFIGKTAEIEVIDDHVCRVNGVAKAKERGASPIFK